jgi:hypothetical protein
LTTPVIVSIIVRSQAGGESRQSCRQADAKLLCLDANAISPMTAGTVPRFESSQVNFVDGCIIGSAARMGKERSSMFRAEAQRLQALKPSASRSKSWGRTPARHPPSSRLAGINKGSRSVCRAVDGRAAVRSNE